MASARSKTASKLHQVQCAWSDTGHPRKPSVGANVGTSSSFGNFLSGGHALPRDFAPAMGDIFPHSLLGLLLRARGPFIGQRGPRENPLLRDAFSRLHATQLARRTGRRRMNLPVIVTAQQQIRNIHLRLADGPSYSATTVPPGRLSLLPSPACSPIWGISFLWRWTKPVWSDRNSREAV